MISKSARFKMKYVGRPNGVLLKGSPGNYTQNAIYSLPYSYSLTPYFELLDPPPVLKVPPAKVEESVFESSIFVPPELDDLDVVATTPVKEVEELSSPSADTLKPVDVGGGFPPLPPKKAEGLFGVEPDDEMPADLVYELSTLGDGVLGEKGVEKVERKRKKTKAES